MKINERISQTNKSYVEQIYNLFMKNGYGEYTITLLDTRLKIKNAKVIFKKSGGLKKSSFNEDVVSLDRDDYMTNCVFVFDNFNELKIEISHEIGHAQEKYDKLLKNKNYNTNTISTHNIINYVIQKMRGDNVDFDVFLDILYRTTDNELNTLHNEIYIYLKSTNIIDREELIKKVEEYTPYQTLKEIESLDFKNLATYTLNKNGLVKTKNLINDFNNNYFSLMKQRSVRNIKTYNFLKYKKTNSTQIIKYYEKWKEIIIKKLEKFDKKVVDDINNVIFDVSNEIKETFLHIDYDKILKYNDYCSDKLLLREEKLERILNENKMKKFTFKELWNRLPESVRTAMSKCEQDPIYHPEGPADIHTKLVFEYAMKYNDPDLLLCAIFHDLGKPETKKTKEKDGKIRISNIGHERKCDFYIDKYFHLYSDVSTNKEKVREICNNHMKAHMYIDGRLKKPSKRESFENLKYFDNIIKFADCDSNGK